MFDPQTSTGTPSATSSPGSACGPSPCATLGGLTIAQFGLALAPANLSARQAKALGLLTSGISGPPSSISSLSGGHQSSMVNRLRAKTACLGSTLFTLTWKERTTPSGRRISALRASVRRTSGSGCSSPPQTGWPTPLSSDARGSAGTAPNKVTELPNAALLAAWGTPTANEPGGTPEQFLARKVGVCGVSLTALTMQAQLTGWATPNARDEKVGSRTTYRERGGGAKGDSLSNQAASLLAQAPPTDSGPTANGSTAETASTARLNPELPRWLMGLPRVWCVCAATAMQSLSRSRASGSKRVKRTG